jgi:catechol 2,3-dioxygenase-like lactoylglutathione lyase family enzyme
VTVTGVHALIYTPEAEALRGVLTDTMGWPHVDAGQGWLIFALPPAELAVHPGEEPRHELSFTCDDIASTVADLAAKGIAFRGEPEEHRWGVVATMVLPGGVDVMLYEPRHPTAYGRA